MSMQFPSRHVNSVSLQPSEDTISPNRVKSVKLEVTRESCCISENIYYTTEKNKKIVRVKKIFCEIFVRKIGMVLIKCFVE